MEARVKEKLKSVVDRVIKKALDKESEKIKKEGDEQVLRWMKTPSEQQPDEKTTDNQDFKKIYLKWIDSTGYDGWVDRYNYLDYMLEVETFAFLVDEYEDRIIVCPHITATQLNCLMVIPKSAIIERKFIDNKEDNMPVQRCMRNGKQGFKWGRSGKCYTYESGNETQRKRARRQAEAQGRAVKANQ